MKNIVITGSSSGFGYLTTLKLARNGYKVWATMRNPETKNKHKKEELETAARQENLAIRIEEMDITNDESVQTLVDKVTKEDGKLDILINNAGVMYVGITEAYSLQQVKAQFETNFYGTIRVTKAFLPLMHQRNEGQIINISSLAGRLVFPYFGVYCASKFALEAYTEALSYELRPLKISVNIVEPGPFPTNLLYSGPNQEDELSLKHYGDMKHVPKKMLDSFSMFFESDSAPDPQQVADDILNLIDTSPTQRPFRVVSGIDYGTIELNEKIETIQTNHIKNNLQMEHLLMN